LKNLEATRLIEEVMYGTGHEAHEEYQQTVN